MKEFFSEKVLQKVLLPVFNYVVALARTVTHTIFISLFGMNFRELIGNFAEKGILVFFDLLVSYIITQVNVFCYNLMIAFLFVLDIIAACIGVIAGTSPIQVKATTGWEERYLIDLLFDGSVVTQVFWGVTLLSLMLFVLITIYAVVRSNFDMEDKKPLGEVLKQSARALVIYLLLPFIVAAGIKLSSVVIRSASDAIGGGSTTSIGTHIFVSVIQEAARDHVPTMEEVVAEQAMNFINKGPMAVVEARILMMFWAANNLAGLDESKAAYQSFSTLTNLSLMASDDYPLQERIINEYLSGGGSKFGELLGFGNMPYLDPYYNYQLIRIERVHSVIGLICCIVILICMIMAASIAVKKLFEIILLYIISPYFIAFIPLDNGALFAKWRDMFIIRIALGFGIAISMEIFLLTIPVIFSRSIMLSKLSFLDACMRMIVMVSMAVTIVKSHSMVTKILESTSGGLGESFDHEANAFKTIYDREKRQREQQKRQQRQMQQNQRQQKESQQSQGQKTTAKPSSITSSKKTAKVNKK